MVKMTWGIYYPNHPAQCGKETIALQTARKLPSSTPPTPQSRGGSCWCAASCMLPLR